MKYFLSTLILGLIVPGPIAAKKVKLEIELPKPMFAGTPKNIRSDNLEAQTGKARGPFYVPQGTKLLSLEKTVTASDDLPVIGESELVTDGDKEGEEGSYVEYGPGLQWVQIDLGKVYNLYAILIWHYHSEGRVYRDMVVQGSETDAKFKSKKKIVTVFNNDHDNSSKMGKGKDKEYIEHSEGKLIDPKGVKARYLRFYSNGSTSSEMNHYIEIEVFGK